MPGLEQVDDASGQASGPEPRRTGRGSRLLPATTAMLLATTVLASAQGEPPDELLDGGVARPDREKDQIALVAADAGIGHEVAAFVNAVQGLQVG